MLLKAAIIQLPCCMIQKSRFMKKKILILTPTESKYLSENRASLFWTCGSCHARGGSVENLYTDFFKSVIDWPYNWEKSTWEHHKQSVVCSWTLMLPTLCANTCTYPHWILLPAYSSGSHCLSELSILQHFPHASYLSPPASVSLLLSFTFTNIWYTNGSNYHC